jgi:DNA repair protein RadC
LLRHFGSLKALSRASFKELRQFLPKGKAEAVMAALSISNLADAEHALSAPLNNPEAIFRANLDMKGFHQEVVRVVLLDAQHAIVVAGGPPCRWGFDSRSAVRCWRGQ